MIGFHIHERLGQGSVGEVWRATGAGGVECALKLVDIRKNGGVPEWQATQIIKNVRHANLLPTTGVWLIDDHGHIVSSTSGQQSAIKNAVSSQSLRATMAVRDTAPVRETLGVNIKASLLVIAMPLADKSLDQRLFECECECECESGPGIPTDELLRYMEQVAQAIDFLNAEIHDLGDGPVSIQHCDVKPANIVIVGNSAQLCDYSVIRASHQKGERGSVGSLAFMAPEMIQDGTPCKTSDQYSLAISYVELKTGKLPFREESQHCVIDAHLHGNLVLSGLSGAEQKVILKATAVDPDERYASTVEMVQALRAACGQTTTVMNSPTEKCDSKVSRKISPRDDRELFKIEVEKIPNSRMMSEAAKWYAMAAKQGHTTAQLELGNCFFRGKGVKKDYTRAAYWFSRAAKKGNAIAQNNLATCYYRGLGISASELKAQKWYRRSAEQGYAKAQANLATCYARTCRSESRN